MPLEFYIYTTKQCNLNCRYCFSSRLPTNREGSNASKPNYDLKKLITLIPVGSTIVFYGGEPLLNQDFILEFLDTCNKPVTYVLHTNGMLLDNLGLKILGFLDYLFVSIDGSEKVNDEMRGSGTYQKIINNVTAIKKTWSGKTLARMTLTPGNPLSLNVVHLLDYFDFVVWQIINFIPSDDLASFTRSYERELKILMNYWVKNLKNGIVKGIVPFQVMASSLLSGEKCTSFRCGANSRLVVVDIDGKFYLCDEMLGSFPIGSIEEGVIQRYYLSHLQLSPHCKTCEIKYLCGGRCLHGLIALPKKNFVAYCNSVKVLVEEVKRVLPILKNLLSRGVIALEEIRGASMLPVEQIP